MTPNEKIAHDRAFAEIASARAVRTDTRAAYYEACSDYDMAYMETYKKHLAEIEFNEAYERVCDEARNEFDKRAAELEAENE
jgi:hypothetical protein